MTRKLSPLTFAISLALVAPALLLAQTAAPKAAPKAAAAPSDQPTQAPKRAPIKRSAAKVVEEMTPIDDDPTVTLTPEDLEIAKKVYVGTIPCELGASVTITPSERRP